MSNQKINEATLYWKQRCRAAENYINERPCNSNYTQAQIDAFKEWQNLMKQQEPSVWE
jgi:hypothetical protein